MARRRNYQAEYAARQARSQERYGVSYNQQRRLVEQGQAVGLEPKTTRRMLGQIRDPGRVRRLIKGKDLRQRAYRRGQAVGEAFTPTACINVDRHNEICGHEFDEHKSRSPHRCKECTCPEYIPAYDEDLFDQYDIPDDILFYH